MTTTPNNLDYDALANLFWEQGFIVIEGFFDAKLMSETQSSIMSHFGDSPAYEHDQRFIDLSKTEVIPWFPQNQGHELFDKLENDMRLKKLTSQILGEAWKNQYCMVMFSKEGSKGQAWHQDCPPENSTQFNLNRLVYSMDVDHELGGQVYIRPGSHRLGALTQGPLFEDFDDQIVLSPKQGTLVLLHGHCWHRIGELKGKYRVSTNYRAAPRQAADSITDICVYRNMRYQFSTAKIVG
ncbi:phytanoyl-CoA dioxygenase family protein [Brumicola pallidula]|jgi:ectoine hydroxylase-related dioxygenase (phytanoyl-CoA dioxygenase family)|uniref:Phytanoyl-CoA dioxygenase superfamily n=1 Tax=Brumicola pallidula DSM 14239 = ACAM 615 TaxID=1121922 RepID=K6Y3I1_9ALTE|nr:phytanoyl-CoA dioxygenase family protein [Glaciecola pallidula]GAC27339.1 Phytanoyl-CoA dioxygenase superfamily [Glaciecola pallidula DSM 14239 = ACAM 615]